MSFATSVLRNTVRLLGKGVIAGGAVYYSYIQGVWGTAEKNEKHWESMTSKAEETVRPYVPIDKVPSKDELRDTWNSGMDKVFTTLNDSPNTVRKFGSDAKKFSIHQTSGK